MNIGIDIDDTISETFETLLPYSQKYTIEDLKRTPEIQMNTNCTNHFYIERISAWNEEESIKFWDKYYAEILKQLNIKKFASNVISELKKQGHKIYLITARWDMMLDDVEKITKKWLKDNNVEYDKLFLNASNKLDLVKENKIDVFIDDSFKNCKDVSDNTEIKVYLMSSKANERFNDKKIRRVFSWPEIYQLINKEEK